MGVLNASSMGNTIPKAVVTSADQLTYMASMPYKRMSDSKAFREVNKGIKEALAGKKVEKPKDAEYNWMISGVSRFYKGDFVEVKDDKFLMIKPAKGKAIKVPLAKLSTGAQAYARLRAGAGAAPAAEEPGMESWESAKGGKTIEASFVSLSGGKITLKKQGGKIVTFNLSLLSDQSRQRAKELAGE